MALPTILDVQSEVIPYFGAVTYTAESALLALIQKFTENQARQFVGHVITQTTISNEYQRMFDFSESPGSHQVDIGGGSIVSVGEGGENSVEGNILQLNNGFVRSITDLREHGSARFGQQTGDFPADSTLTSGRDYFLESEVTGLSKSGRVIRAGRDWSSGVGTIRITYVAGLTAAELADEYSFVKLALLEDMQTKFNFALSQRNSKGPVKKEAWAGDYSVEYVADSATRSMASLSPGAQAKLQPIKRINL